MGSCTAIWQLFFITLHFWGVRGRLGKIWWWRHYIDQTVTNEIGSEYQKYLKITFIKAVLAPTDSKSCYFCQISINSKIPEIRRDQFCFTKRQYVPVFSKHFRFWTISKKSKQMTSLRQQKSCKFHMFFKTTLKDRTYRRFWVQKVIRFHRFHLN